MNQRPRARRPGEAGCPPISPRGRRSLIVYGPSLSVVNLTLYAFAHAANPKFLWVNIRARNEPIFAGDPAALGWVPREQLLTFDRPEAIRPNATVAAAAVSQLIAADEPTTSLNRLLEFVQLPDFTQCLLAEKPSDGRPGLLAVPNTHALTSTFTTTRVEAIIDAHVQAGYSLFVGYPKGSTGTISRRDRRGTPSTTCSGWAARVSRAGPKAGSCARRDWRTAPSGQGQSIRSWTYRSWRMCSAERTRNAVLACQDRSRQPSEGGTLRPARGSAGRRESTPVEGDLPSPWRLGLPGGLAGLLEDLGELAKTPGEDNGGRDHARGQGDECC